MSNLKLYLDIETATEYAAFADLPEDGKAAFLKKFKFKVDAGDYPDIEACYQSEAALFAEFSKVICVSIGTVVLDANNNNQEKIYVKGLVGREIDILKAFAKILAEKRPPTICAHNGKRFDFPFLCRRMTINDVPLPDILNVAGKKPWEVQWEDTAEKWSFSDNRHYTSLITLCYSLGIPSPKNELDGSKIGEAYRTGHINKIKEYCGDDVIALIHCDRKIEGLPKITADPIKV